MAKVTYFVVLPFVWDSDAREHVGLAPIEAKTADEAIVEAGNAEGAVAFSRMADIDVGEYGEPAVLARWIASRDCQTTRRHGILTVGAMNYYVVVPFIRNDEGELVAEDGIAVPNAVAAIKLASSKAALRAGAAAFNRRRDRGEDDGEMTVFVRFGETPPDLDTFDMRKP